MVRHSNVNKYGRRISPEELSDFNRDALHEQWMGPDEIDERTSGPRMLAIVIAAIIALFAIGIPALIAFAETSDRYALPSACDGLTGAECVAWHQEAVE